MGYTAIPDRRMPIDVDGSTVGFSTKGQDGYAARFAQGVSTWITGADLLDLNDQDYVALAADDNIDQASSTRQRAFWVFFPEQRNVTAIAVGLAATVSGASITSLQGSANTTNGVDGSWSTATVGGGAIHNASLDGWRANIASVSFAGAVKAIRFCVDGGVLIVGGSGASDVVLIHVYGAKAGGQTPNDILFLDGSNSYGEFTADEDFGDKPLGTTAVRTFKVKNSSGTLTASTISVQCNDSDFAISTDNANWVTTINLASLAPGASSPVYYVRCTTPSPGALVLPRAARIIVTAGSWA